MSKLDRKQLAIAAKLGESTDSLLGHLTPGEVVLPLDVASKIGDHLASAFADAGMDPNRYVVGSQSNKANPQTGLPGFFGAGSGDASTGDEDEAEGATDEGTDDGGTGAGSDGGDNPAGEGGFGDMGNVGGFSEFGEGPEQGFGEGFETAGGIGEGFGGGSEFSGRQAAADQLSVAHSLAQSLDKAISFVENPINKAIGALLGLSIQNPQIDHIGSRVTVEPSFDPISALSTPAGIAADLVGIDTNIGLGTVGFDSLTGGFSGLGKGSSQQASGRDRDDSDRDREPKEKAGKTPTQEAKEEEQQEEATPVNTIDEIAERIRSLLTLGNFKFADQPNFNILGGFGTLQDREGPKASQVGTSLRNRSAV